MGTPFSSSSSDDWLELGLGLFKTTNKQQQQPPPDDQKEFDNDNDNDDGDLQEESLDLRLQIGENYKMKIKKDQKWGFHLDYSITKFGHYYFHNNNALFSSSSSSPNSGLWFSLTSLPNTNRCVTS